MLKKKSRANIYEIFYENENCSLIDLLYNSSCDELLEVDLKKDTVKRVYHVEGKYYSPLTNLSFSEVNKFAYNYTIHPDDREIFFNLMNPDGLLERLKKKKIPNFDSAEFRYKLVDGSYRYVQQCIITGLENDILEGELRIFVFDIHNFMVRQLGKSSNNALVTKNNYDPITGLLNGKYFNEKAKELVKEKKDIDWCVLSMDIEHFKLFDDWYGREKGDYLLTKIGLAFNENDKKVGGLSGYFGQDDFASIVPFEMDKIECLYEKIRDIIVSFGLSVGFMPAIGISKLDDLSVDDALDRASIAASHAKKDISKRIYVYNPELNLATEKEYHALNDFMNAYKNDEISFYLQPQCRISTGKIVGAEALARWIKPDGTVVPPIAFIPVLEKYGFITDLDKRIWEKVCQWIRKMLDQMINPVPISVNVSRSDMFTIDVAKHFEELTAKYNIPHNLIKVEITESAYAEKSEMIEELVGKLRKHGFLVLMDDFGSGYSSLNMLSTIKVDAIKLDANFLHVDSGDQQKGVHILESVVNMARQISLPIIVEGVENKRQSDFLEEMGCRYVQGYFFYKPLPIPEFEKLLHNKNNIDERGFVAKLNEQVRIREFLDENIYSDNMLNNIIGVVAFYSWHGTHIDIVRFNQQFYESVNVPDFQERLLDIQNYMNKEDRLKIYEAFKNAIKNKLMGASSILKFSTYNGTILSFRIHFYYLGKKEGRHRFYGSAINVTELTDLIDERKLIAKYSSDNLVFVKRINEKWVYNVVSHGLSDVLGISPEKLEEEMNNGVFAKRVVGRKELAKFMKESYDFYTRREDFEKSFTIIDANKKKRKLILTFNYAESQADNICYILRTRIDDK